MSTKARRFDLYPDEFIVGTLDLTLEERGLYMTICCLLYSRGKPIERNHADLAKKCGCSARLLATVLQRLLDKRKLYLTADGLISNERCEQEIARAAKRIERAREAGLEGGRPPISDPGSAPTQAPTTPESRSTQAPISPESSSNQDGKLLEIGTEPHKDKDLEKGSGLSGEKLTSNQQPSTDNLLSLLVGEPTEGRISESGIKAAFERFWAAKPGRGEATNPRKPAFEKFRQIVRRGVDPEVIIAGMRRYADAMAATGHAGTERTKQGLTFLSQEIWNDYPPPGPASPNYTVAEDKDRADWRWRIGQFFTANVWSAGWGPSPADARCRAPQDLIDHARAEAASKSKVAA